MEDGTLDYVDATVEPCPKIRLLLKQLLDDGIVVEPNFRDEPVLDDVPSRDKNAVANVKQVPQARSPDLPRVSIYATHPRYAANCVRAQKRKLSECM